MKNTKRILLSGLLVLSIGIIVNQLYGLSNLFLGLVFGTAFGLILVSFIRNEKP